MTVNIAVKDGTTAIETAMDRRQDARFPMGSTIRVQQCDGGSSNWMSVQALNLSHSGVAFLSSQPIAVGVLVQVELPQSRSSAIGPVRSCQRRGNQWRIGVQLARPFLGLS